MVLWQYSTVILVCLNFLYLPKATPNAFPLWWVYLCKTQSINCNWITGIQFIPSVLKRIAASRFQHRQHALYPDHWTLYTLQLTATSVKQTLNSTDSIWSCLPTLSVVWCCDILSINDGNHSASLLQALSLNLWCINLLGIFILHCITQTVAPDG